MLKNKHVIVAMLVAPVLAIMAWFGVDYFVAERPQPATDGGAYPLVAKSNCRYDSGRCDLENADFEMTLRPLDISSSQLTLELTSRFPLQQATIALVDKGAEAMPLQMSGKNAEKTEWGGTISSPAGDDSSLRIAVISGGTTFFAEVPVVFLVLRD
jgi:hypothetical protein